MSEILETDTFRNWPELDTCGQSNLFHVIAHVISEKSARGSCNPFHLSATDVNIRLYGEGRVTATCLCQVLGGQTCRITRQVSPGLWNPKDDSRFLRVRQLRCRLLTWPRWHLTPVTYRKRWRGSGIDLFYCISLIKRRMPSTTKQLLIFKARMKPCSEMW